jgi:hypothetical protein
MITQSVNDLPFMALGDQWARRVVVNGGPMPSGNTLTALASFNLAIRDIRSQIVACNFFALDSVIAARTPLIVGPSGVDPWDNLAHDNYDGRSGLNGWALNIVGDPTLVGIIQPSLSGLSFNSAGVVLYGYDIAADPQHAIDFGALHVATGDGLYFGTASGNKKTQIGKVLLTVAGAGANGFYSCQRTGSTSLNMYFANSGSAHASIGSIATAETGDISNLNFSMGIGMNTDGTFGEALGRIYSFAAVTTGMNATDSGTLYAAVQALRTSLGGGFV